MDERPVVGRGRRADVLGKGCAELLASTSVGRVVLVVGEWLLTAAGVPTVDGDRSDNVDAVATLRALPGLSIDRGFEIECGRIGEILGTDESGSPPRHFGIEYDVERGGIDCIGGVAPAGADRLAAGIETVLLFERVESIIVGVAGELPAVFDVAGFAVAVIDGDIAERTAGDRVVVGEDALSFGVSPRSEHLGVVEASVGAIGRALAGGLAYTAVWQTLQNDLDLASAHTHWEFFEAYTDRGVGDDRLNVVQRLTELCERATFSQRSLSPEMATTALENAETVADQNEQTSSEEPTSETDSETDS